jgi:hypothetical protein
MQASIHSHDAYFSRIISWISPELYHPKDTDEEDPENDRYYKHKKQPLTKDTKKMLQKKKRKEVYSLSSSGKEGMQSDDREGNDDDISNDNIMNGSSSDIDGVNSMYSNVNGMYGESSNGDANTSSMDDLRQRLQQRILGLKEKRMKTSNNRRNDRRNEFSETTQKHVRNEAASQVSSSHDSTRLDYAEIVRNDNDNNIQIGNDADTDVVADAGDVIFSDIRGVKDRGDSISKSSNKPGSKTVRLKRMIDSVEKKRKRLQDLNAQGDEGKKIAQQEVWGDMMKEAAGDGNTTIDIQKVKKALKKKEKGKEKSAIKWKERQDKVTAAKNAKIDKREHNLLQVRNKKTNMDTITGSKSDTKERKAVSSPRSGFEGRKRHLLNDKGKVSK